jgi:hypothetical protein
MNTIGKGITIRKNNQCCWRHHVRQSLQLIVTFPLQNLCQDVSPKVRSTLCKQAAAIFPLLLFDYRLALMN